MLAGFAADVVQSVPNGVPGYIEFEDVVPVWPQLRTCGVTVSVTRVEILSEPSGLGRVGLEEEKISAAGIKRVAFVPSSCSA